MLCAIMVARCQNQVFYRFESYQAAWTRLRRTAANALRIWLGPQLAVTTARIAPNWREIRGVEEKISADVSERLGGRSINYDAPASPIQLVHLSNYSSSNMPSRRKVNPPPSFSFVTTRPEVDGVSWFKIHSGAARSHAAYWGGPEKVHHEGKKHLAAQQNTTTTSASDTDRDTSSRDDHKPTFGCSNACTVLRRRSTKPKNVKAIVLPPQIRTQSPRHVGIDNTEHLPTLLHEIRAIDPPSAYILSTFEFFGEGFVRQFVMSDHEDYSVMFSACLLLSYAHSMALTGQGTKTILLELKSQVIQGISAKMGSSVGLLSPQYLTAILALGAPIVCMVSQDLPQRLSISDYINVSAQEDYLCCPASANTAQRALEEQIVHRQAMRRLFSNTNANFKDADNLALLQYISNSIDMYAIFRFPCIMDIY